MDERFAEFVHVCPVNRTCWEAVYTLMHKHMKQEAANEINSDLNTARVANNMPPQRENVREGMGWCLYRGRAHTSCS